MCCGHRSFFFELPLITNYIAGQGHSRLDLAPLRDVGNIRIVDLGAVRAQRNGQDVIDLDLLSALQRFRGCQSSDPRDKVYAMLSITTDGQDKALDPDYSLTVAQVYTSLAIHLIQREKRLDILGHCTITDPTNGLPSWVPDWSVNNNQQPFGKYAPNAGGTFVRVYNCSGDTLANVRFVEETRALVTKGLIVDNVKEVCESRQSPSKPATIVRQWKTWAPANDEPYTAGGTMEQAFCHTLTADVSVKTLGRVVRGGGINIDWLRWMEQIPIEEEQPLLAHFYAMHGATMRRAFLNTSKGYMGLGPESAEPGDLICVLLGGSVPYMLRQIGHHYRFLGECYIHGIMDGEAMKEIEGGTLKIRDIEIR